MRLLALSPTLLTHTGFSLAQEYFIQLSSSAHACTSNDYGTAYIYGSQMDAGGSSPCQNLGGYPIAKGIMYCAYFDYDDPNHSTNCNGAIPFAAHSVQLTKSACGLYTEKDCQGDLINLADDGKGGCTDLNQAVQSFICSWNVLIPHGSEAAVDQ